MIENDCKGELDSVLFKHDFNSPVWESEIQNNKL